MIAATTHQGYVRLTNEDAALAKRLDATTSLLAVADGVGGYPGGEVASRTAIDTLRETATAPDGRDPAAALQRAFEEAGRRVREGQRGDYPQMSTTLVAAVVHEDEAGTRAWIANVGDCRAYIAARGALRQVTRDHSWVEEEIRAGRLRPEDPLARAARHVITRSIGGPDARTDHFGPEDLAPGDVLLLCSDGLHGPVPPDAILAALAPGPEGAAERLVQAALDAGGPDNIAVALYAR